MFFFFEPLRCNLNITKYTSDFKFERKLTIYNRNEKSLSLFSGGFGGGVSSDFFKLVFLTGVYFIYLFYSFFFFAAHQ